MPATANLNQKGSARLPVARGSRSLPHRSLVVLAATVVGWLLTGNKVAGQEIAAPDAFGTGSPLLAYAASISISPFAAPCPPETFQQQVGNRDEFRISKAELASLFERPLPAGMGLEPSIALTARHRVPPGEVDLRPRIKTGYGYYFEDDQIGYSRISGVGHRERDCLYLKFSLAF